MIVTRHQFDLAAEAVWSEIQYQNNLPRRTDEGEATDVPGFLTLGRRYMRKAEDAWADTEGDPATGYTPANETMRKLAGIFIRAMIYTGVYVR